MTSSLGFVYWWLAARTFPQEAVGVAAAYNSAAMLLASIGSLGIGALLVSEVPQREMHRDALVATGLLIAATGGAALAVITAVLVPDVISPDTALSGRDVTVFGLGVGLTAIVSVADQLFIGMLQGNVQLRRNTVFAVSKLLALAGVGAAQLERRGNTLYATWVIGILVSLIPLTRRISGGSRLSFPPLPLHLIRHLAPAALAHHALNLELQAPTLVLPLAVAATLGATATAHYYTASMIAGLLFVGPGALANVLFAVGAKSPVEMRAKLPFTIGLSLAGGTAGAIVLAVGAERILLLFGPQYIQATTALRLFALAVFPYIVKNHYVSIARAQRRTATAAVTCGIGAALEIAFAVGGLAASGLTGLMVGWLAALVLEAIFFAPNVYRVATASLGGTYPRAEARE